MRRIFLHETAGCNLAIWFIWSILYYRRNLGMGLSCALYSLVNLIFNLTILVWHLKLEYSYGEYVYVRNMNFSSIFHSRVTNADATYGQTDRQRKCSASNGAERTNIQYLNFAPDSFEVSGIFPLRSKVYSM